MRLAILLAGFFVMATPTFAQNVGLMIANEDYARLADVKGGRRVVGTLDEPRRADVEMIVRSNATLEDLSLIHI